MPCRAGAAGAAGAVDVDLGRLGEGVVEDVREVLDVDAARRDVGGHQELDAAGAHAAQHALAIALRQVGGDRLGVVARAGAGTRRRAPVSSRVLQKMMADFGSSKARMRSSSFSRWMAGIE